jgi:hypothetical protein
MNRRRKDDRWPNLMKPSTAAEYLDMGAEKFKAEVAPLLKRRQCGARFYYRKADLDKFSDADLDQTAKAVNRRSPSDWLKAVANDLDSSPRRQARHR